MMKLPVTPKPSLRAMRTASTVFPTSASLWSERSPRLVGASKPKNTSKFRASGRHRSSSSGCSTTVSRRDWTSSQFLRAGAARRASARARLRSGPAQNVSSTMKTFGPVAPKSARTASMAWNRWVRPWNCHTEQNLHRWRQPRAVSTVQTGM